MSERNLKQIDIVRMAEPYCRQYRQKLGRNDVSQFVSGKVNPGQWKLTILGLALNVSEAWLMGYDVPMTRDSIVGSEHVFSSNAPPVPFSLTEGETALLALFHQVPEDKQQMILDMIRIAVKNK